MLGRLTWHCDVLEARRESVRALTQPTDPREAITQAGSSTPYGKLHPIESLHFRVNRRARRQAKINAMKSPLPFVLTSLLFPGCAFAAQPALSCRLSIYALGAAPSSLGKEIVGPDQVVSASYAASTIVVGGTVLRVHLTKSGAAANRDFSAHNIGKKIAILCGDKVVARPTIAGQSGETFVVEGIRRP